MRHMRWDESGFEVVWRRATAMVDGESDAKVTDMGRWGWWGGTEEVPMRSDGDSSGPREGNGGGQ